MEQENLEKLKHLERIVSGDPICRDYGQTLEELESGFGRLLRELPARDARKIEIYLEYRRLYAQRMLWLACENMAFEKKE